MRPSQVPHSTVTTRQVASVDARIRARIDAAQPGKVFGLGDFSDIGSRAAIDKVLSRLATSGALRRIARGLYDVPRDHALLGPLLPSGDDIAQALAEKGNLRLQPSGAYAANLLGLIEQVPIKLAFLTDGVSRKVQVGSQTIIFTHTTPRNMATAGRTSGMVIQALRHLKRDNVGDHLIAKLRDKLTAKERTELQADAALAPAWISAVMHRIAS